MPEDRIVECVPNFSEGRDTSVIQAIAGAMDAVDGAHVLDVDPGRATNRTVMTVVGAPDAVVEAAFQGIREAAQLIDMSAHQGEHPRMGATDVCPFVPVRGLTMDDCVELARRLGRRVGEELEIPVFLYEYAASSPGRRNLAAVRAGEYEGLAERLGRPEWHPDFGPAAFKPRHGATAVGARKFLIAYNVNLSTRSKKLATEIALEVREGGRNLRGPDGRFLRDPEGNPRKRPGRLRNVKAVGWFIEEYGRAQISANLTDYEASNLNDVFDACEEEARRIGVRVTGSELVGLVPLDALLRAGRHYLARAGESTGVPETRVVQAAVRSLGLDELGPFDPREKVIEYRLEERDGLLREMTLSGFTDELSTDSPAPGGGSVAALCGAVAAGLAAMVGNLTHGRKAFAGVAGAMEELAVKAQELKDWCLAAIDADTRAFNRFMEALRMPADGPEAARSREAAMEAARWEAVEVPLSLLRRIPGLLELAERALEQGNPNAASDAATAAACARAAAEGAHANVAVNCRDLEASERRTEVEEEAGDLLAGCRKRAEAVIRAFGEGGG